MRNVFANAIVGVLVSLGVAGCDVMSLFDRKPPRIPGERISVLQLDRSLEPDARIADLDVRLPRPFENPDWMQAGGQPDHALHHLALANTVKEIWRQDTGAGSDSTQRILAQPIVAGSRVFVMDSESVVSAYDRNSGKELWRSDPKVPDDDDEAFGGGLAFEDGRVFVSTGFAQLFALDAATGREIWRQNVPAPMRAAPTVSGGRVFIITIDNQLIAFGVEKGERLWSHAGFSEVAGLLGGASPTVSGSTVIAPYSSGEVYALRVENGRVLWSDNLSTAQRLDALSTLSDIRGMTVVDRGLVYAISHAGRMVAIDLRTGSRAWERSIGGVETPWVAGEFIFILTTESELVCLTRRGGRIRWVLNLPRFEEPDSRDAPIKWTGPILAGDRLIITGSHGEVWTASPYTGKLLGRQNLGDEILIPPIVAGATLFMLAESGELFALR